METPSAPVRPRRRRLLGIVTLLVVITLVAGSVAWLWLSRPFTIAELGAMIGRCPLRGGLREIEPGRGITVEGALSRLRLVNTSLGPYTEVWLDQGSVPIMYRGDARSRFATGAWTRIPLTVQTYRYNGIEFCGTEEYLYPGIALSVSPIFSGVSRVAGIGLDPALSGPDSMTLRLASHRGEAFPLSLFRFSLVDVQGTFYLGESGYFGGPPRDEIEGWTPTGNGSSPDGWLSFRDAAGNGLLDIGDEITIRGNRTSDAREFDSRLLLVNNASGILAGVHYWYETSDGMMSYADAADAFPYPRVVWGPLSSSPAPPESVDRFRAIVADRVSDPVAAWSFTLRDDMGRVVTSGPLRIGDFLASGDLTGTFIDVDANDRVSVGDELEIRGGRPRARYTLDLAARSGMVFTLNWRCGYGLFTGWFPIVTFSNEARLNPTAVELDVRVSGGFPYEEARNFTLGLSENGTRVLNLDLSSGVSSSGSGITFTYVGGGDPMLLDRGDRIRLDGLRAGARYTVEAAYRWRSAVSGNWTFQN